MSAPSQYVASQATANASADFQRVVRALRRNWRYIFICAACTLGAFLGVLLFQPYIYRAGTSLVSYSDPTGLGELGALAQTVMPGLLPQASGPNLVTELDVIQSRTVLGRVAEDLHLQVDVTDHARTETLARKVGRIAQAVMSPGSVPPPADLQKQPRAITFSAATIPTHFDDSSWTLTRTGESTYSIVDDETDQTLGTGTIGEPFAHEDLSFTIAAIAGDVGDEYGLLLKTRERAIDDLKSQLAARRPKDRSDVLLLEVSDQSPVEAKIKANAIADAYLDLTQDWKGDLSQGLAKLLEEQIATAETDLTTATEALNEYRAQTNTVSLSDETRGLITALTDAEVALATQRINVSELQYAYDRLKKAPPSDFVVFISGNTAGVAVQATMIDELAGLIAQRDAYLTSRTAAHPEVQSLDAKIAAKKDSILGIVQQSLNSAKQTQGALGGQVSKLNNQRLLIPATETKLSSLMGDVVLTTQLLTALKTRQQQNDISQASQESPIRILDLATAPIEHDKPRPMFSLLVGLMAGLVLGVSITMARELLDTTIRRRDQAEAFGLPVIAMIPRLQEHLRNTNTLPQRLFLAIRQDPSSPVAESFRILRAATSLATGGVQGRVLGITSPGVSEGKTLVTLNLATMYAQAGFRTLVIDCDLRRPAVARSFGLPQSPGLSDILEGRAELRDALRESGIADLQLLPAGQRTANASELLTADGFQRLLQSLRKESDANAAVRTPRFDVILLDLPPVAPVSETAVLGRLTSALYVLFRAGRTTPEIANDVLRRLEQAKVAVRGVILNDVSMDDLGETARYLYYDYTDESTTDDRGLWDKLTGQGKKSRSRTSVPTSPIEP